MTTSTPENADVEEDTSVEMTAREKELLALLDKQGTQVHQFERESAVVLSMVLNVSCVFPLLQKVRTLKSREGDEAKADYAVALKTLLDLKAEFKRPSVCEGLIGGHGRRCMVAVVPRESHWPATLRTYMACRVDGTGPTCWRIQGATKDSGGEGGGPAVPPQDSKGTSGNVVCRLVCAYPPAIAESRASFCPW